MKSQLEVTNANYCGVIVSIPSIRSLPKCDNIIGVPLFGMQALVSKETKVGDIGIFFPAECKLSQKFLTANNLYRDKELNLLQEAKGGFFEATGRVRAIKLRGIRSDCFFIPLKSLDFLGATDLKPGDCFNSINNVSICEKFVRFETRTSAHRMPSKIKKFCRVDTKFMPEHIDTANYWRNKHLIPDSDYVTVTQKLHGTSVRIGHTLVARRLSKVERFLKWCGLRIAETEFDIVYASRRVIKDASDSEAVARGYYDTDLWCAIGKKYAAVIPQNFLVFGEIIGWSSPERAIQSGYTYDQPKGCSELYVYRVATITNQGRVIDLSWDQVKGFCEEAGMKHVPELARMRHDAFVPEDWIDKRIKDDGYKTTAVQLSDPSSVDEGVVIRFDGVKPVVLKAKSPIFLGYETKMIDAGVEDLEDGVEVHSKNNSA